MRYRFRLERVLDLREKEEELRKREFSTIMEFLKKEEIRAALIREVYEQGVVEFLNHPGITPHALEVLRAYLLRVREELKRCEDGVKAMRKASEAKLEELQAVKREVKALEYLREKGLKRHKRTEVLREQSLTDEYNSRRHKSGLHGEGDEGFE